MICLFVTQSDILITIRPHGTVPAPAPNPGALPIPVPVPVPVSMPVPLLVPVPPEGGAGFPNIFN